MVTPPTGTKLVEVLSQFGPEFSAAISQDSGIGKIITLEQGEEISSGHSIVFLRLQQGQATMYVSESGSTWSSRQDPAPSNERQIEELPEDYKEDPMAENVD